MPAGDAPNTGRSQHSLRQIRLQCGLNIPWVGSCIVRNRPCTMTRKVINHCSKPRSSSKISHAENVHVSGSYGRAPRSDSRLAPWNGYETGIGESYNSTPKLTIGIDFGTTGSGVAYTPMRLFGGLHNFRTSDHRPRQRVRLTHSMVPRHSDTGVFKYSPIAVANISYWLRPRQFRAIRTHEPPFYEVYPRLSDPPTDI